MIFDKLLEYQEIDKNLFRIEREINNSEEKERAAKLSIMLKNAGENMSALNVEADELMANIEKSIEVISASEKNITEIEQHIDSISDLNEVEFYEKKLATLAEDLDKSERELLRLNSRIDYIKESSERLAKQAVQINAQYKKAYEDYTLMRNKLMEEGMPINEKLKSLEKEIPVEWIEIYKRCRTSKRLPAFIVYKGDGSCYCGMNLPNDSINKLKSAGDKAECPNCGRIIIVNV